MDYIRCYRARFGVESICSVLQNHGYEIAPSTFYAYQARGFGPTNAELEDAYMANEIFDLWVINRRVYGRRKLYRAVLREGMSVGRDKVERLMKILHIEGVRRGKRQMVTTIRDEKAPRFPDHIERRWDGPDHPDQWWVAELHLRVDPVGILLRFLHHRRVLTPDSRVACHEHENHHTRDLSTATSLVHQSPPR